MQRDDVKVVWQPLPGTSQELALSCPADEILYHGTRGPGKTLTQLMRFRRYVGIGYGEFWRGVIFDVEFDNLSDMVAQSRRFFPLFEDGCKFLSSASAYKWVWPTGEELLFRHVKRITDYDGFHGHEYPFIGWNELTKQPSPALYDKFLSCNRSSFVPEDYPVTIDGDVYEKTGIVVYVEPKHKKAVKTLLPEIPLQVFSTTNPNGPGHNWVKARFIDVAAPGQIVRRDVDVFNPRTQQDEVITLTQVAIFGSYRENIFLPPKYIANLDSKLDPNLRRAWLMGDWDVVSGGALDDVWDSDEHVLPRFRVPASWRIDRSFDWGSTHPFSVGWWAVATGEEVPGVVDADGNPFAPVAGSLIQLFEWYGGELGTNQGSKLGSKAVAVGIKEREAALRAGRWINGPVAAGPADNQIWATTDESMQDIAASMQSEGVTWERSDKSQGSRKNGLQLLRDRLTATITREGPGIYFMRGCTASIQTLPTLQRDPIKTDDVDTTQEDHAYDMVRYRVLHAAKDWTEELQVQF